MDARPKDEDLEVLLTRVLQNSRSLDQALRPAREVYTIAEFCIAFDLSRAYVFKLWKAGIGPPRATIGRSVRILREDALTWYRDHYRSTP